jgi:hypothetical protein
VELQEPGLGWQGRSPSGDNREARVPKPRTGADRPVVVVKALQWGWSEGDGSGVVTIGPTGNRMTTRGTTSKPFTIEKRLVYVVP